MSSDQKNLLGLLQHPVDRAFDSFKQNQTLKRFWEKDPSLWKNDPNHQKVIRNRLGWFSSADWLLKQTADILEFQKEVKNAKFTHTVLLGMGGSSLAPEVFRETFGHIKGFPKFCLLDSTDPDQVLRTEKTVNLAKTLFIVSSKSGTTLETACFFKYFFQKVKEIKGERAGENFIAITDSGSLLESEAKSLSFRRVFINPTDIGGRFSVLSYFGMVPAAVIGISVEKLIDALKQETEECKSQNSDSAILLGFAMSEGFKSGRDKLTIFMSPKIRSYGLWVEQLIAESLGKEGKGIVPIFGEKLGKPADYAADRLFVYLNCSEKDSKVEAGLKKLESAGQPVIRIRLRNQFDLGRQFFRWSIATAIAGIQLGVNPFDEPNVQEAKDWTKKFLDELKANGKFLPRPLRYQDKSVEIEIGDSINIKITGKTDIFPQFFKLAGSSDYFNLAAYLPYGAKTEKLFERIRLNLHNTTQKATMFGFGPRYLHSTGQLHKGGPNSCLVILVTAETSANAQIPGQPFGFKELEYAQALGDFQALVSKGRRAIHVHLKKPVPSALLKLEKLLNTASS